MLLIIAAVVLVLVVRPYNAFRKRFQREAGEGAQPVLVKGEA